MNDKNKEMHILLYHAQDDDVSVNALVENETLLGHAESNGGAF